MIALLLAAQLTVFAASSLREAFQEIAQSFEHKHSGARVQFQFAGSQELRVQLENGAKADVIATADARHMQALQKQGLVRDPRIFARNQPVLVVPEGNPAGLHKFADLPQARRIVLGAPEVPIGAYTLQILDAQGPEFRKQVEARVVSRELNVRQVLAKVALGEADAAIVYRTDAVAAGSRVEAIEIPGAPPADYPIASGSASPLARQFIEFTLSREGQAILASFGFAKAP